MKTETETESTAETYEELVRKSALHFKLDPKTIYSRTRIDQVIKARHCVWHYLHIHEGWTRTSIALMANRDNSSIRHGIESYKMRIETGNCPDSKQILNKEAA